MSTLMVLFLALLAGQNEESATEDLVRQLVRQLNHDELAQREGAERNLVALGPDVLELLPPLKPSMEAEVRLRLDVVRGELERIAALKTVQATTVTLTGKMSLSKIFEAFQEQTSNKVVDFRDRLGGNSSDIEINVNFERVPFWQALDSVLDQAKLAVYTYGGEQDELAIVNRDEGQYASASRVAYGGVFRVEATHVRAIRDLKNPDNHGLQLSLEISWEPRLLPVAVQQPLDSIVAIDESGYRLPVDGEEGSLDVPVHQGLSAIEMHIPLTLPKRSVLKIASLKGKLNALVPGREETFEFDNVLNVRNIRQRKAGVSILFERLRRNDAVYEAKLLVQFDNADDAMDSHYGWVHNNKAYLVKSDNKRVSHAGYETWRREADVVGLVYKFVLDEPPTDYKFIYKTPTEMVRTPVTYELKDIELP